LTSKSFTAAFGLVLLWAIPLSATCTVAAQESPCIFLSAFGQSTYNSRILSQPVTFTHSNGCLQFSSGLSIWETALLPGLYLYPCKNADSLVKLDLLIYPNPTTGSFQIRSLSTIDLEQFASLSIYNQIGQLAYKQSVQLIQLRSGLLVSLHSLPAGVYYLLMQGKNVKGIGSVTKINE